MFSVASSYLAVDKINMNDMIKNLVANGIVYNKTDTLLNIKAKNPELPLGNQTFGRIFLL